MVKNDRERPWRNEKVIIVLRPRLSEKLKNKTVGDWLVVPPNKPISPGMTLTWKSVPPVKMELFLPGVFDNPHPVGQGTASSTVREDAPEGFYFYEAYCDEQLATGGSSPGVIVDP